MVATPPRLFRSMAPVAALSVAAVSIVVGLVASARAAETTAGGEANAKDLAHRAVERRAIEAVIWGMPAVNYHLMYQAMVREAKGGFNQIVFWSRLLDWKNQTLTPNPDVIYLMPFFDTKDVGPVVLEIPPADDGIINGSVMNYWQAAIEDVGPAGVDKGKGGKYLILPPGYAKDKVPAGYIAMPSDTYRGYALLRSVLKGGSAADIAQAVAYAKRIKLHPLTQASDPPPTSFVDASDAVFDAAIPYDMRFFHALDEMVQAEPWLERDKAMIDQLKTIGIERGKPFRPDAGTQQALNTAMKEAKAWLDVGYEKLLSPYYEGGRWMLPANPELFRNVESFFQTPDSYPVDARGITYTFAFFSAKHLGAGQFYLMAVSDRDGKPLDGKSAYRLRVPPNVPVNQYWSATVYNRETHTLIRNVQRSGRSSQTPGLQRNADDSVDIFFGPNAPPGREANWVPTDTQGRFEVLFRFYGPEKPLFDKTWVLSDIEKVPATLAAQAQSVPPSPLWVRSMPPAPDARVKITEAYAALVARDAYFWAWPLVNVYNRRLSVKDLPDFIKAGPVPSAPLNRLAMLTDYVDPQERLVACPNQDVVYGVGLLGLDISPVVIQVPDFGERFWVYQVVDTRTDSFVQLGKMYGTTPGFYLLAGPNWQGDVPKGITKVLRSATDTGFVAPRIFQDDTPEDKRAIQGVLQQVMMYPLSEYDGTMKRKDWTALPQAPAQAGGDEEVKWVVPERFFDELAAVLADAPPLPGEEARYAQVRTVLEAAKNDAKLKAAMTKAAAEADEQLVKPLFQFRNYGQQLPHHWSTIANEAAFGTDYFTRTAVAKSNIFVNSPNETKYYYQDLDNAGARLNGANRYVVTFPKGQTPAVNGFWSLTLYNEHHFFIPNPIRRYSVGTKNKDLKIGEDGSLAIYVQADEPADPVRRSNWLPAPKGGDFSLYIRAYWPKAAVADGSWTPPAVQRKPASGGRALQ